jgi:ribosomal protein L7/L12
MLHPLTIMTFVFAGVTMALVAALYAVVARVDRKMDLLLKHSGLDLKDAASREAAELMKQGKKVEAVKLYRETTGVSRAEAKAAVERM